MDEKVIESSSKILLQTKRKKTWKKIVALISSIVVLCTAYALIMPAITMEGISYCGKEEHQHDESCYEQQLICAITDENHEHTDECYDKVLICGKEEHQHTLICYSNPDADVETQEEWEATIPKELSGTVIENLISVAKSQIGYKESELNYFVTDNNDIKGYTRYGAWYGDEYGDWSAMFVSFCLNYANISEDAVPYESDCQNWVEKLKTTGIYKDSADYIPTAGDIVFFDNDKDSVADHVGLITEMIPSTEFSPIRLSVIEGDANNKVKNETYKLTDDKIFGYGHLPFESEETGISLAANEISTLSENIPVGNNYYHSSVYPHYESVKYGIKMFENSNDSQISTFILVPKRSESYLWTPDTLNWSADGDHNYLVTYCVDPYHATSATGGVDYTREQLSTVDEFSDDVKNTLAAIVHNSYPFITEAEMKSRLADAGITGTYGKAEMMAATQWAIWFQTASSCTLGNKTNPQSISLNGVLEDSNNPTAVTQIKEWLINTAKPNLNLDSLSIVNAEQSVSDNGDGTYDVTVNVKLNHAIQAGDSLQAVLSSLEDDSKTTVLELQEGLDSFSITLSGLSSIPVNLSIRGIQKNVYNVYFYRGADKEDGGHYQHFISGNHSEENVDLSYSFSGDDTFVSVKKNWVGEGEHPDSITAYLIIDGIKSDKFLVLNNENNWSGRWDNLPTGHKYEVQEETVPGYTTSITSQPIKASSGTWVEATNFKTGNVYLLESSGNLFGVDENGNLISAVGDDLKNNISPDSNNSYVWSAEMVPNSGGYRLTSGNYDLGLFRYNQVKALGPDDKSLGDNLGRAVKYKNSKLYFEPYGDSASYTCYITGLPNNGIAASAFSGGRDFKIYTWNAENGNEGTEFTITNTEKEVQKTSVSVLKEWSGDSESDRPDQIQVTLYADGAEYKTATVTKENNWAYTWTELPVENDSGEVIDYTVKEKTPEGYVSTVLKTDTYTFTITNKKVEVTSVSVEKRWSGLENGQAHPDSVQVYLLANNKQYGENVELNEKNGWMYCWNNLPKVDSDGNIIEYTVDEVPIGGYSADIQKAEISKSQQRTDSKIGWKAVDKLTDGKTYLIVSDNGALAGQGSDSYLLKMLNVDYAISNDAIPDDTAMWSAVTSENGFLLVNKATQTPLSFEWSDWSMNVCFNTNKQATPVVYTGGDKISAYWSYNKTTYYLNGIRTSKPYMGYGESTVNGGLSFTFYELQDGQSSGDIPAVSGDTHFVITNTYGEYELAETGGIGTHWFILGGLLCITVSLISGGILRQKRGRRSKG